MPPGFPNPDPISDQTEMLFFTPVFRPGFNFHSDFQTRDKQKLVTTTSIRTPTKRFVEINFESAYHSFFLIHWNFVISYSFGIEITSIHSRSSLENHTRFQTQTKKNLYPFSDRTGPKTIPFGAAQTYMTHIREYPQTFFFTILRHFQPQRKLMLLLEVV